ncbi:MAG: PASTA domain-containing protein [Planctomycetota bacterium]|jgi:beta-lactam-binding protein with PASTA domain
MRRGTRIYRAGRTGLSAAVALAFLAASCVVVVDEAGDIVDIRPGVVVTDSTPPPTVVTPPTHVVSMVVVPGVVGHTYQSAEVILTNSVLGISRVSYRHSSEPAGTVLGQSPHAGTIIRSGSGVALTLSISRPQATVPNVVGKSLVGATLTLRLSGLTLGTVSYVSVQGIGSPRVGSQSPGSGSRAAPGTPVDLVVHNPSAKVIVPNVVGSKYIEASRAVRNAGLRVTGLSRSNHPTIARGSVVQQSPRAGAAVDPNTGVNLVLSSGSGNVSVPNVVGRTAAGAVVELTRVGFLSNVVKRPMTGLPGRVKSQSPLPGTSAPRGTVVTLVVSQLMPAVLRVPVPDIAGRRRGEADAILAAAGLRAGTVTEGVARPGRVISQNPAARTLVTRGTAVSYVIGRSRGRPPTAGVPVPSVVGLTQASATIALRRAGFSATVTKAVGSRPGRVISQTPAGGALAARGSAVTLVVATTRSTTTRVRAPDLKHQTATSANAALVAAGLRRGTVAYGVGRPGRVVSQSPAAGALVAGGTAVSYIVGRTTGRPRPPTGTVTVPNLVGMQQAAAEAALRNAGLAVGTVTKRVGPQQGKVLYQSPSAGARVARGTSVRLTVAEKQRGGLFGRRRPTVPPKPPTPAPPKAPAPAALVSVPNVTGMSLGLATVRLKQAGLTAGTVSYTKVRGGRKGRILRQLPAAAAKVARGSSVALWVSR